MPLPPNLPGLAATVARVESLPPDVPVPLAGGGAFRHWREKIETSATVVRQTADGWPALIRAAGLHYLAGWAEPDTLTDLLQGLAAEAGLATTRLPDGLRLRDTATHRFAFNYGAEPVDWQGQTLPPAGVAWTDLPG